MKERLKKKVSRLVVAMAVIFAMVPVSPADAHVPHLTPNAPYITLTGAGSVTPIISVGEEVNGVMFEGLPDGIGATDGAEPGTVDVYVAHEQTTVPFFGSRDFQDASVTKLTLDTSTAAVLDAQVVIDPSEGYKRFCSASMGTVAEGFDVPVFMTGEEDNSTTDGVQAGFAVVLNTETGESTAVPGMGRLNHENTVALPGYNQLALLTTDDTFSGPSAQLYMYVVQNQQKLFDDLGRLYAFQVTHDSNGKIQRGDAFNGANDYLDLEPGDDFQGRFIPVPKSIAKGDQSALENWSNDHNIFQFIRLEDLAYDKNDPSIVYIADTGRSRVVPDADTGRLVRGPSGTTGMADNGSVFKMVFDANNPRKVTSFTVLAQGDNAAAANYVAGLNAPDNMDTSTNSLMIQEDTSNAEIWRYDLGSSSWSVAATVNDPSGESSGIVDASAWFGAGAWILDVQAHGTDIDVDTTTIPGTIIKREDGQVMLMTLPGS